MNFLSGSDGVLLQVNFLSGSDGVLLNSADLNRSGLFTDSVNSDKNGCCHLRPNCERSAAQSGVSLLTETKVWFRVDPKRPDLQENRET